LYRHYALNASLRIAAVLRHVTKCILQFSERLDERLFRLRSKINVLYQLTLYMGAITNIIWLLSEQ